MFADPLSPHTLRLAFSLVKFQGTPTLFGCFRSATVSRSVSRRMLQPTDASNPPRRWYMGATSSVLVTSSDGLQPNSDGLHLVASCYYRLQAPFEADHSSIFVKWSHSMLHLLFVGYSLTGGINCMRVTFQSFGGLERGSSTAI